jgi:sugar lactone lactonase YvrE
MMPAASVAQSSVLPACVLVLISLAAAACGPAQPASVPPPQSSPLEFIGQWGVRGEAPGELAEPVGIAVDLNARVYLADRRTGLLQKFESGGVPLFSFEDRAVRSATSLAVDSGGAIYIADAHTGRMGIYFPDGAPLRNFRVAPQRGVDGSFGFSVAADGTVFVPDPDGGRVQAFRANGRLERIWRLPPASTGEPARPVAVAASLDEFVYVGDARTGRIVKYTHRGAQVAVWEPPADAAAPLQGLALSRSHLFALRGATPRLEVWTLDGQLILTDGFDGRLNASPPASLSLTVSRDEQVFLLDPAQPRVLRFRLRLPAP